MLKSLKSKNVKNEYVGMKNGRDQKERKSEQDKKLNSKISIERIKHIKTKDRIEQKHS